MARRMMTKGPVDQWLHCGEIKGSWFPGDSGEVGRASCGGSLCVTS